MAATYSNGAVVDGLGGGICQISSTLYDAVVMANLKITTRRNHKFVTSYLPAGKDATVVWGSQDFKFVNSRKYPIRITATVQNGVATIQVWGIKEEVEYDISIETKKIATIEPATQYIKTPIYLRKHFFYYYFDCEDFLTFDIDDLFYYSTRTITRRGGHLFVADYGMQVNILSRYGIKNYAVKDRDYRFINGNTKDLRYANIEIINRFHGVTRKEKDGKIFYETKIHWNGNLTVGRYDNEIEAAIAYNKAASVLLTKGYEKNYPVNYIEELTKEEYRNILKNITVSKNIYDLTPLP